MASSRYRTAGIITLSGTKAFSTLSGPRSSANSHMDSQSKLSKTCCWSCFSGKSWRTGRLVLISLLQSGLAVLATPHLAERGGNRVVQTLNLARLKSRKGGAAAIPRHVAKGTSKPLCKNPGQWILLRTIAKPFFRLALRVSYRL